MTCCRFSLLLLLGLATSSPLPRPRAQANNLVLVQAREGHSLAQSRQDVEDVQVPAGEAVDIFYRYSETLHSLADRFNEDDVADTDSSLCLSALFPGMTTAPGSSGSPPPRSSPRTPSDKSRPDSQASSTPSSRSTSATTCPS